MRKRVILHSDINCCYAAIEHLYRPEFKNRPLAVAGEPEKRHGIILTADYMAKKYGVKTGMPIWQAKNLCPFLNIVEPRMDLYLKYSKMAKEIYCRFTDRFEAYGIDEGWLDVTESSMLFGSGLHIAKSISEIMKKELGLTVSIGVSYNKIFAKLGSDYKKPDAITTMYEDEFKSKAWPLPARDLLYVGRSTDALLKSMGIRTIGDLARAKPDFLEKKLGKAGKVLWIFANGYDESPVKKENESAPVKSIGNSTTVYRDLNYYEEVRIVFYVLAESVGRRLRENRFKCRAVEISIRDNELYTFTRRQRLVNCTDITGELAEKAMDIFIANFHFERPVRSLGLRACDLVTENFNEQLSLFTDPFYREKQEKLDTAIDKIRKDYGYYSIQRGIMFLDGKLSNMDIKEEHIVHPLGYFR